MKISHCKNTTNNFSYLLHRNLVKKITETVTTRYFLNIGDELLS